MRKLCILCCSVLLCIAVCFPAYADLVVPGYTRTTVTEIAEVSTEEDDAGSTTVVPSTTAAATEDTPSSPFVQRLHAVWAAVVAAAVAVAAFFARIFHKK